MNIRKQNQTLDMYIYQKNRKRG